jgi:hypothetical protein
MTASERIAAIRDSDLTIYDAVPPDLRLSADEMKTALTDALSGVRYDQPIRTRSKLVKSAVCEALGYPVPASFKRTQPRLIGQNADVYVQKSNNLQLWNEEVVPDRRYIIVALDREDVVCKVVVVSGDELAKLDTTGTLTGKHQARITKLGPPTELVSATDTEVLQPFLAISSPPQFEASSTDAPKAGSLLAISVLHARLSSIVGRSFPDPGSDQERNRGEALHRLVCESLGYGKFGDTGAFPDVRHQLLEIKLQTAPTIDLGIALPNETTPLDVPPLAGVVVTHRDTRYCVVYADRVNGDVVLSHVVLVTGQDFFGRFPQMEGKRLNKKLQLRLPSDLLC